MTDKPDNAIVVTDLEVLVLKKLLLVNHALGQVMSDPLACREQQALTRVLSDVVGRADLANSMAKCGKPVTQEAKP